MGKEKKTSKFAQEFKAFVMKGNVVDMAVGVVVGGAFSKIVSSLVADVIMPLVGLLTAGVDLKDLKWILKEAVLDAEGVETAAEVAIRYGNFLQLIVDFLIIAFSIFVVLKVMRASKEKRARAEAEAKAAAEAAAAAAAAAEPPKPTQEELLAEIRDLLRQSK